MERPSVRLPQIHTRDMFRLLSRVKLEESRAVSRRFNSILCSLPPEIMPRHVFEELKIVVVRI